MIKSLLKKSFNPFLFLFALMLSLGGMAQNISVNMSGYTFNGCRPQTITFTVTDSTGTADHFNYNFSGNNYNMGGYWKDTSSPSISYTFTQGGQYNIEITAMQGNAQVGKWMQWINIGGLAAFIESSTDSACVNEKINFQIHEPVPSGATWYFGDGASAPAYSNNGLDHTYGSAGTYVVKIKANTSCGMDSVMKTIFVSNTAKPKARFNHQGWACPTDPVQFNPENWNAAGYSWNFGDPASGSNNTSTMQNAVHQYTNTGAYLVSLTVSNSCGQSNIYKDSIHISNGLTWSMNGNNMLNIWRDNNNGGNSNFSGCPGEQFDLYTAPAKMYSWDFGDTASGTSDTSTMPKPSHTFNQNGTYTVSVTLTNGCGDDTTVTRTITIGSPYFGGNPQIYSSADSACANDKIQFEASSGGNNSGGSYFWNFGDGTTSTQSKPMHSWGTTGMKTVSVTIQNACGNDTTIYKTVKITTNVYPTLSSNSNNGGDNWGLSTNTVCIGDTVYMYAMGGASYSINFGDGYVTTNTRPLVIPGAGSADISGHAYASTGTYWVKLTYYNNCGKSATDSLSVTVGGNQRVNGNADIFQKSPYYTCENLTFNANGGSTYKFKFGNGDSLVTGIPFVNYTYSVPGSYNVSITITNGCGNDTVISGSLDINSAPTPVADAGGDVTVCGNDSVGRSMASIMGSSTAMWSTMGSGTFYPDPTFIKATYIPSPADIASGSVKIILTTTAGYCGNDADTVTVTFKPKVHMANAGPDQTICGSNANLAGNPPGPNETGFWGIMSGTGTLGNMSDPFSGLSGITGNVSLVWTLDAGSCGASSDTMMITKNASATASVSTTSDKLGDELCSGSGSITFTAHPVNGGTPVYQWKLNGSPVVGASNVTYTESSPVNNDQVTVSMTSSLGCVTNPGPQSSNMITVTVDVPPTAANAGPDQAVSSSSANLSANTPASGTGMWMLVSGTGSFTASNASTGVTGLKNGPNVFRWVISNGACAPSTDDVVITYTPITGLINTSYSASYNVHPNPFSDEAVISFSAKGTVLVKVTDMSGKVLKSFEQDADRELKVGSDLNAGVYFIQIISNDKSEITKVIKY